MPDLILSVPTAQVPRLEAVAVAKGWTAASGMTKQQFIKKLLLDMLRGWAQDIEMNTAGDAARASAKATVESEFTIT